MKLADITIPQRFQASPPSDRKLNVCRQYFKAHGALDRTLVVDSQGVLLDGYVGYLVLRENGIREYGVSCADKPRIFIAACHEGNPKEYYWCVTHRTADVELLIPGAHALVQTKNGMQPVRITQVFTAVKSPRRGRIRGVIRGLPALPQIHKEVV